MTTINQLTATDTLSGSDLMPVFSQSNGDARKVSITNLSAFIDTLVSPTTDKITQYYAPSATGFTASITDNGDSIWLVLTPAADYATATIQLPKASSSVDKQEVLINTTHAVTTLTVNTSDAGSVIGSPTSLAIGDYFTMRFEGVTKTWYRVG